MPALRALLVATLDEAAGEVPAVWESVLEHQAEEGGVKLVLVDDHCYVNPRHVVTVRLNHDGWTRIQLVGDTMDDTLNVPSALDDVVEALTEGKDIDEIEVRHPRK